MAASVTIDDRVLEFEPGESVIQVAKRSKIEIPYYCWHPKLSVAANCRMCLVDVEKSPKLVPACQTECKDGMVVHTKTEKVKNAQRSVHEFLLINHPVDCPICDQAGECKLQNYYMKYHLTPSRMRDDRVHKQKLQRLGPYVMYNAERCIVCTRCVRFMAEVAGERQLGVFNRGDHSEIGVYPGQPLDNAYSLNTVDVCPVGALTSTVFRFKQRVWNLQRQKSICSGCARGCNVHLDHRSGLVYRLLPRENNDVNQVWLCDEGRLTYNRHQENRVTHAAIQGREVTVPEALREATQRLKTQNNHLLVLSMHATNEEAQAAALFAKNVLKTSRVVLAGYADGVQDELLRVRDKNPNRAGVSKVFKELGFDIQDIAFLEQAFMSKSVSSIVWMGHEVSGLDRMMKHASSLTSLIHLAHARSEVWQHAHVALPILSSAQMSGHWENIDGFVQELHVAFGPQGDAALGSWWFEQMSRGMALHAA